MSDSEDWQDELRTRTTKHLAQIAEDRGYLDEAEKATETWESMRDLRAELDHLVLAIDAFEAAVLSA